MEDFKHLVKLLDAKEQLMQWFFNNALFGVVDDKGYFVMISDEWVRTLGWSEEELKKDPFISKVHPDDVDATMEIYESEKTGFFSNRYQHKEGHYIRLYWDTESMEIERFKTFKAQLWHPNQMK